MKVLLPPFFVWLSYPTGLTVRQASRDGGSCNVGTEGAKKSYFEYVLSSSRSFLEVYKEIDKRKHFRRATAPLHNPRPPTANSPSPASPLPNVPASYPPTPGTSSRLENLSPAELAAMAEYIRRLQLNTSNNLTTSPSAEPNLDSNTTSDRGHNSTTAVAPTPSSEPTTTPQDPCDASTSSTHKKRKFRPWKLLRLLRKGSSREISPHEWRTDIGH
jgi:hypothetical protein